MRFLRVMFVMLIGIGLLAGCSKQSGDVKKSSLTVGMAKKFIYPNKTTQAEIMEIFGPPDLVTRKSGNEVWTYDKISYEMFAGGGFLTIFIAGYGESKYKSSNVSTMLIIYFDKKDVVEDYAMSVSKF